jgi:hypothetical protein
MHSIGRIAVAASTLAFALCTGAAADVLVDDPDDICSPTADPCLVTQAYDVQSGVTLDFGTRAVIVTQVGSQGELDFGAGSATILCGDFTVEERPFVSRILLSAGGVGGAARIVARGKCSLDGTVPCLSDRDCDDASAGVCSAGTGSIVIADKVQGSADPGGTLRLVAHDSIETSKPIDLDNASAGAHGGSLELDTKAGSIDIGDSILVQGGSKSYGGEVTIHSAGDLTLDGNIDASGGEDRGGAADLTADGDIFINDDINVRSSFGAGTGGTIQIHAQGNLTFSGVSATDKTVMDSLGHRADDEPESGDGGDQRYSADGTLTVGPYVRLDASGPDVTNPDSEGGEIELSACTVNVQSLSELQSNGKHGGSIQLIARTSLTVSSSSTIDALHTSGGRAGDIALTVRPTGTCSNNWTKTCLVNADCTVGCSTGTCNNSNLYTGGTLSQFDPTPVIVNDPELPGCG